MNTRNAHRDLRRHLRHGLIPAVLAAGLLAPAAGFPGPTGPQHPGDEVLVEWGRARPLGELGDTFDSELGLAADDGYEIGFRWRRFLGSRLTIGPAFHFMQFGTYREEPPEGETGETFEIDNSIIRYGVDLTYLPPAIAAYVQPFLSAGVALCRNRYREKFPDSGDFYAANVNSLGYLLGGGFRFGRVEMTAVYTIDRCRSRALPSVAGGLQHYRWDNLSMRVGWVLPLH